MRARVPNQCVGESNKDDLGGAACMLNSDGISTRRQ